MVWYTQVELVLVISVLTRIFKYLNNKIDLADFQKGEGAGLKSENSLKMISHPTNITSRKIITNTITVLLYHSESA